MAFEEDSRLVFVIAPEAAAQARREGYPLNKLLEDASFAWRWLPVADQARICAATGELEVVIEPAGLKHAGHDVNAFAYAGGGRIVLDLDIAGTSGAVATIAHEFGHSFGELSEAGAWRLAARWLADSGTPAQHCRMALEKEAGHAN